MLRRSILLFVTGALAPFVWFTASGGEADQNPAQCETPDLQAAVAKVKKCECPEDICTVSVEAGNAGVLRDGFQRESEALAGAFPKAATDQGQGDRAYAAYRRFVNLVPQYVPSAPGYNGPNVVHYSPYGYWVYQNGGSGGRLALETMPPQEQCRRTNESETQLINAVKKSQCQAIAEAIVAHECYHFDRCVKVGSAVKYMEQTTAAASAAEEAQAYGAQLNSLMAAEQTVFQSCKINPRCSNLAGAVRDPACWGHSTGGGKGIQHDCPANVKKPKKIPTVP